MEHITFHLVCGPQVNPFVLETLEISENDLGEATRKAEHFSERKAPPDKSW